MNAIRELHLHRRAADSLNRERIQQTADAEAATGEKIEAAIDLAERDPIVKKLTANLKRAREIVSGATRRKPDHHTAHELLRAMAEGDATKIAECRTHFRAAYLDQAAAAVFAEIGGEFVADLERDLERARIQARRNAGG